MEKKMIAKFKNEPKKKTKQNTQKGYFQKANNGQQR